MSEINKTKLLERNVILLDSKVSSSMALYVKECLTDLEGRGSPDIEVQISSEGGDVKEGLEIYGSLLRYNGKKTGVVRTHALSMGAIILQACDERICLPGAIILIHRARVPITLDDIEDPERLDRIRFLLQLCENIFPKILTGRTGRSEEEISAVCKRNKEMTAQEAKEFGLIDHIKGE